jgi:hypothetical protein
MGTAIGSAKTSLAFWDAFADAEAFVDEVVVLAADGSRPRRAGPELPLTVEYGLRGGDGAPHHRGSQRLMSTNRH